MQYIVTVLSRYRFVLSCGLLVWTSLHQAVHLQKEIMDTAETLQERVNTLEQRLEDAFHALNEGTMPPDRYTALNNGLVAQLALLRSEIRFLNAAPSGIFTTLSQAHPFISSSSPPLFLLQSSSLRITSIE